MYTFKLQVDAKYMVTVNIATDDGLVNGSTGHLRRIVCDQAGKPHRLWLEFPDEAVGRAARRQYCGQMRAENIPPTWTPVEQTARAIRTLKGNLILVERKQFPVTPAEAITVHKSQGGTFKYVAVHLKKAVPRNSLYVACSRATSLDGLFIFGTFIPPKKPSETDAVLNELRDLRENKRLVTTFCRQFFRDKEHVTVTYQNVQSFPKHQKLIANNPLFTNSDILLFVETWVLHTDPVQLEGFTCFAKLVNDTVRKPFGILCYKKDTCPNRIELKRPYIETVGSLSLQAVHFSVDENLQVLVVYIPPKFKIADASKTVAAILMVGCFI